MNHTAPPEPIPWESLCRYACGDASPEEAALLSARLEHDPEAAAALAEILLHAVAIRDEAEVPTGETSPKPARRGPWIPFRATGLAAAAGILLTSLVAVTFPSRDQPVIVITELNGAVRWTGQGGRILDVFETGRSLPGGILETVSAESAVTARFRDGSRISLPGDSTVTISDDGQKRVHLRQGGLSATVEPQAKGKPMLIHTPTALLEVLGTRFEVDSHPGSTRLTVDEGTVRVTRLIDGRVAEVPAEHTVVASLRRQDDLDVTQRTEPLAAWRSDLSTGPAQSEGAWLPADGDRPARLQAEPRLLTRTSRGNVTIHRVGIRIPGDQPEVLHASPSSRLRLRGRIALAAPLEIMVVAQSPEGGFAGNFFHQTAHLPPGTWDLEIPLSAFRAWRADTGAPLDESVRLRHVVVYTIDLDAALELERIEVLHPTS